MVFLPECFDYVGEKRESTVGDAETVDGSIISNYKSLAKQLGIWLSLGGFHEKVSMQSLLNVDQQVFSLDWS